MLSGKRVTFVELKAKIISVLLSLLKNCPMYHTMTNEVTFPGVVLSGVSVVMITLVR